MQYKVNGIVSSFTDLGGYPTYYITQDCGVLCAKCVNGNLELCKDSNDAQWYVTHTDVNWESTDLNCAHCSENIESAYGDKESEFHEFEECEYEFADGE